MATGFLIAFFWAVRSGQFEDDYTPSVRILFDDEQDSDEQETISQANNSTKKIDKNKNDKINFNEK
jgi:cbb3-type cytochrome oxidase maturation protein